jgi:hypothetical protein
MGAAAERCREEEDMTIVRRVILAVGSIATLALAGGAHFRAG